MRVVTLFYDFFTIVVSIFRHCFLNHFYHYFYQYNFKSLFQVFVHKMILVARPPGPGGGV